MLHAGLDILTNPKADGSPASLAKMIELCPNTTFVAAHMGGCHQWEDVETYLVGKRIYFDTSLASEYLKPEQFRRIVECHGIDRILFGSDSPWCAQKKAIDFIDSICFTEKEKQRIFYKNALSLLSIHD